MLLYRLNEILKQITQNTHRYRHACSQRASPWQHSPLHYSTQHLTEGSQSEHAVELPLLGVSDDVRGVAALLGAMEPGPPEVSLAQQAEHTQLPVDLRRGGEDLRAGQE